MRARRRKVAQIIAEKKEKVPEVRLLASKNMAEKMADMEENSAELRQFNHCKTDDMEQKAAEMSREMRRKPRCIKGEMKTAKSEEYEFLAR